MRRILLLTHRWIGIVLAIYVFVIGLSGAALVFHDQAAAISRVPKVTPTSDPWMAPDEIADRIRHRFPEMHLHTIFWPENSSSPWFAEVKRGDIGYFGEDAYAVYLHPTTGEILHVHNYGRSIWRWLQVVHINLAAGRSGRFYNSVLALVLVFVILSGIFLWAPLTRAARAIWTINWSARPKRLIWEIHQVAGIWALAFLLLFSATGAYFGWRGQVHRVIARWFPMALLDKPLRPVTPVVGEPLPISAFLTSVQQQVPDFPITRVLYPEQTNQPIRFVVYEGTRAEFDKASSLFYHPVTGELLRADLYREQLSGDRLALWLAVLHFGAFKHLAPKLFWGLGALSLPLMAITGVWMFVNRYRG